jgi:hypothetical protein
MAANAAAATSVASAAQAHTAGSVLVALIQAHGTVSGTPIDIAGNTYHKAGSTATDGANFVDIWYAYNIAGNAANVVTANFSGSVAYRAIVVHEFSGFGATDPYATGSQVSATGTGTALSSGTSTFTGASAVIVGFFIDNSDSLVNGSPAYSLTAFNATGDPVAYFADGYRIVTASEAAIATGASAAWLVNAASFQLVAAAPTLTYDEWIDEPSAQRVILADVQAAQPLRGWTFDSATAVYRLAYDPFSHPTTVRTDRGLYRGLDAVWENGVALTVRASLALVQANASSYFFDEPNQTLYVRTSGSVNPDTVASILAIFHVCVATEPVHFAGQRPYDAQLSADDLPSLLTEQADPLLGVNVYPSGSLSLANADGFWDTLTAQSFSGTTGWLFENFTVTFRIGGDALAFSDYQALPPMQIARPPAASVDTCVFQLRSLSNALGTAFPQHTWDQWDPTSAQAQNIQGQYMPMLFGYGFDLPMTYQNSGGSFGFENTYLSVDPILLATKGMIITVVYARPMGGGARQVVPTTDYNPSPFSSRVDIDETNWPHADWTFSCDGYTADSFSTFLPVWTTAGAMLTEILALSGIPAAQINTSALTALDTSRPQRLGIYVPGGADVSSFTSAQDLINLIERSLRISIQASQSFTYDVSVWDPSFDLADTTVLDETEILSLSVDDQVSEPRASSVTVRYAHNITQDNWLTATSSSTEAAVTLGTANSLTIDTCLVDAHDAAVAADRALITARLPTLKLDITTGPRLFTAIAWQKFRVSMSRGPSTSAAFDQVLEVLTLNKRLADFTVDATLGNMRGLGESARVVGPAGGAAWASASADARRQYAFVTSSPLKRADPSDPASFRPGVAV